MAKITKTYGEQALLAKGYKQADLDALDNKTSERDFFLEDVVYGSDADPEKGKWVAEKTEVLFEDEGKKPKKTLVWTCSYQRKIGEEWIILASLSRSVLLANSKYDFNGNLVKSRGDIRTWANIAFAGRVLDREVFGKLAELLNQRGYRVVKDTYKHVDFPDNPSRFKQLFFADTFNAENDKAIDYTKKVAE